MIDVTKCMGCRSGINTFQKTKEGLKHFDLFYSASVGAIFLCPNAKEIEPHLVKDGHLYRAEGKFKEFFSMQNDWLDDIMGILEEAFHGRNDLLKTFFGGDKETDLIFQSNEEIEHRTLEVAKEKGIEILWCDGDADYPDLLKWKTKTDEN